MWAGDPTCRVCMSEWFMKRVCHRGCVLFIIFFFILFSAGCAALIDYMPSPPEFLSRIELKGPYDRDIPEKYVGQLRGASISAEWAIPYIFISVGIHFESEGEGGKATHFFDRSIEEFRKANNFFGEGSATNRKVFALHEFGKIQEAFNVIRQKEREWPSQQMKAFVSHNYGHYFLMNGDYGKASHFFTQALAENSNYRDDFNLLMLRRDSELELGISVILADYVPQMSGKYSLLEFDQAMYEAMRKKVDAGIAHLKQVLLLNREMRQTREGRFTPETIFQVMEANVYNFLGLASGIKGDWEGSRKYLTTSLELARNTGFRVGEIDSIFFQNQVYLLEKNITEGKKTAEKFHEIADRYRFPFYQVWAKFLLARYHTGFGNMRKAIEVLREAVDVVERQRADLMIDVLKETYLFNRQMVYEALIELLAREGDFRGALGVAERAKSRVLVDLLAGKNISRNPFEAALLREADEARREIWRVHRKMHVVTDETGMKGLVEKREQAENRYRGAILRLKSGNEELASMISVRSVDPSEIQNLLDQDTTLFDYFVTEKVLYVWAVHKERIHLERIQISREELRNLVSSFLSAIQSKDGKKVENLSGKLYDTVLRPIIPFVTGDKIGFIPHDSLYYLPFSAMSYKGQYLTDAFSLFSLPNAGVLKYVMNAPASKGMKILAFGNPDLGSKDMDLRYAAVEVERIRERIPHTTVYLGKEATKARVMELLDKYDIVHFATHNHFVPESPMDSSLMLAPGGEDDGRLTALEIMKLLFRGRAIVLSACQTALGMSSTGTEIVGLNRSFLYAGSPSVVSTLWNVDDQATSILMDYFYKYVYERGIAGALRQGQIEMIRKGYAPYYWAPFIVMGRY